MQAAVSQGWLQQVKLSGAALRDAERSGLEQHMCELAAIVEQCADLVCVTDRDGLIEYVNPAFERATGYAREELLCATPSLLKSGAHDELFFAALWRTLLAGQVFSARFENRRKDGERLFVDKTITPIRDARGVITHFVSTGRDVTAQVRADERLERAQRALAMVGECHRAVLEAADLAALFAHACCVMVELGGYRAAWVGLAEHDAAKTVRAEGCSGLEAVELAALCGGWGDDAPGPLATAIRTGCTTVSGGLRGQEARGMRGVIAVPLSGAEGVLGALALACSESESPSEEEIGLLEELAGQIGFAFEALRGRGLRRRALALLEAAPRVG
ncbi:MAG TPA: PAS domain S-box protein [Burkholderiales bacterium]|nr:PAS domain S-box protein [Burkholderiales bacterium]